MKFSELIQKKIAIVGLGQEGVSVLDFLVTKGAKNITGLDARELQDLGDVVGKALKLGINLRTGPGYLNNLNEFEVIVRSPGVPANLPQIKNAVRTGSFLTSLTKIFFELNSAKTIGVTGSKGKGTTATLIYEILKRGLAKTKVHMAGNMGVPMLDVLDKIKPTDVVVLELSSFQLEDLSQSPQIAVMLNIVSEHLSHHGGFHQYVFAKTNLVRHQTAEDLMIFNVDYPILLAVARSSKAKKFFISRKQVLKKGPGLFVKDKKIWMLDESGSMTEVMSVDEVKIRGEHNLENVLPAIAVGSKLGVDPADIRKTVGQFKGLPHRLQLVGKIDNVEFYNDSIATIPEAVIAAIKSFEGPLAIILGGSSKGSKFDQLAKAIERRPQTYAVLMGATSSTIAQNLEKHARKVSYKFAQNMTQAVEKAHQFVKQTGGVVLLSPACASFDMYANFQKRGEDFEKQVKNIK